MDLDKFYQLTHANGHPLQLDTGVTPNEFQFRTSKIKKVILGEKVGRWDIRN